MAQRLDKLLALSGERSRTEAAALIRAGRVTIDLRCLRDPSAKISESSNVLLDGKRISTQQFQYVMMNKPAGVLTAATDSRSQTVMDLLPASMRNRDVMPIGRLDKDTTGLLLFTNDGVLAHRLLDPKRTVWKRYRAVVTGKLDAVDIKSFESGIPLKDFTAQPAGLVILRADEKESVAEVNVHEGKFHQVKRMFAACGHEVTALHRASVGPIELPAELTCGAYRTLTDSEIEALRVAVQLEDSKDAE